MIIIHYHVILMKAFLHVHTADRYDYVVINYCTFLFKHSSENTMNDAEQQTEYSFQYP